MAASPRIIAIAAHRRMWASFFSTPIPSHMYFMGNSRIDAWRIPPNPPSKAGNAAKMQHGHHAEGKINFAIGIIIKPCSTYLVRNW
jgi:hypothetical protein